MQEDPSLTHFRHDANFPMVAAGVGRGADETSSPGCWTAVPPRTSRSNEAFLALHRKLHGREDLDRGNAGMAGGRHEARHDFEAALRVRGEVFDLKQRALGESHWLVTDARLALENIRTLARLGTAAPLVSPGRQCVERGALPISRGPISPRPSSRCRRR